MEFGSVSGKSTKILFLSTIETISLKFNEFLDFNNLSHPQLRKFPTFPETRKWAAFCFFFKSCFWWWSGGEAVFLHLGKSSGNIIGQFPQCTNFLPQETTFWYHTLLREFLGIYLDFNLTSYISGVFAQMTYSKAPIEGHFRQ